MSKTKEIILTQGMVALVDAADYDWLNKFKWYEWTDGWGKYAVRTNDKVKMHRLILEPEPKQMIDHKNGNGLDNRRANLRICSSTNNQRNRRRASGKSEYKGVNVSGGRIWAGIRVNGVVVYLGGFGTEKEAAVVYDAAALKYFGEFACTNEMMGLL